MVRSSQLSTRFSRHGAVCRKARAIQNQSAYILFNWPQWPKLEKHMNTDRTTRLAAFALALLVSLVINGTLLWQFDTLAQDGVLASAVPAATVTLETVTIVGART